MPVKTKRCSCGVEILLLEHERTRYVAPIDPEPAGASLLAGNIVVNRELGTYRVIGPKERETLSDFERAHLHLNHFVTCPDRARYSERRVRAQQQRRQKA